MLQPVNDSFPTYQYFLLNQLTEEDLEQTRLKHNCYLDGIDWEFGWAMKEKAIHLHFLYYTIPTPSITTLPIWEESITLQENVEICSVKVCMVDRKGLYQKNSIRSI